MIQAILFDLDDTLLGNDVETFVAHYFALLGEYAAKYLPPEQFLAELMTCTQAMIRNTDPALTNHAVFWQMFSEHTGLDAAELQAYFDIFYAEIFPRLEAVTQRKPAARPLIADCFSRTLQVVIATNPLFPRTAIEQRLAWAGVPVSDFDYDIVTTIENMHAAKPNPAYYEEILAVLGCPAEKALMVGDSWKNDIVPAKTVGLHTYWIPAKDTAVPDSRLCDRSGSLAELYTLVQSGWLETIGTPAGQQLA